MLIGCKCVFDDLLQIFQPISPPAPSPLPSITGNEFSLQQLQLLVAICCSGLSAGDSKVWLYEPPSSTDISDFSAVRRIFFWASVCTFTPSSLAFIIKCTGSEEEPHFTFTFPTELRKRDWNENGFSHWDSKNSFRPLSNWQDYGNMMWHPVQSVALPFS